MYFDIVLYQNQENVPALVSIFNKLKNRKGVPTSQLIMMYTSLAETQVRETYIDI